MVGSLDLLCYAISHLHAVVEPYAVKSIANEMEPRAPLRQLFEAGAPRNVPKCVLWDRAPPAVDTQESRAGTDEISGENPTPGLAPDFPHTLIPCDARHKPVHFDDHLQPFSQARDQEIQAALERSQSSAGSRRATLSYRAAWGGKNSTRNSHKAAASWRAWQEGCAKIPCRQHQSGVKSSPVDTGAAGRVDIS